MMDAGVLAVRLDSSSKRVTSAGANPLFVSWGSRLRSAAHGHRLRRNTSHRAQQPDAKLGALVVAC